MVSFKTFFSLSILLLYGMLTIKHAITAIAQNKIFLAILDGAKTIRDNYVHLAEPATMDAYLVAVAQTVTKGIFTFFTI